MAFELRVVSGKYRHQRLLSPASSETHPMGAREKLALFNMLTVEGLKIADLYSGTGALGIEALSRGAAEVCFVEKFSPATHLIRQNLQHLPDYSSLKVKVFSEAVSKFIMRSAFLDYFEAVIADPPYKQINLAELTRLAYIIKPGGVLALSTPSSIEAPTLTGLTLRDSRVYAGARLSFYDKIFSA